MGMLRRSSLISMFRRMGDRWDRWGTFIMGKRRDGASTPVCLLFLGMG
jgi:hypothetical protein